jgi:hypothetical protein
MRLSVVLLTLPLVMVFAAEESAPKKTKTPAKAKNASAPAQQPPRVVVPPGFGPRVGAAQSQPASAKSPAPKPEPRPSPQITPAKNPVPAVTIPDGAKEVSPNVFHHTDAKGTTWIYSRTPFGVSKTREDDAKRDGQENGPEKSRSNESPFGPSQVKERGPGKAATPVPGDADSGVTAKDLGDLVEFGRPTPFGVTRWERSKSELTEAERAILEREKKKSASTADRTAASRP